MSQITATKRSSKLSNQVKIEEFITFIKLSNKCLMCRLSEDLPNITEEEIIAEFDNYICTNLVASYDTSSETTTFFGGLFQVNNNIFKELNGNLSFQLTNICKDGKPEIFKPMVDSEEDALEWRALMECRRVAAKKYQDIPRPYLTILNEHNIYSAFLDSQCYTAILNDISLPRNQEIDFLVERLERLSESLSVNKRLFHESSYQDRETAQWIACIDSALNSFRRKVDFNLCSADVTNKISQKLLTLFILSLMKAAKLEVASKVSLSDVLGKMIGAEPSSITQYIKSFKQEDLGCMKHGGKEDEIKKLLTVIEPMCTSDEQWSKIKDNITNHTTVIK